jgi:hypothetical protein
MVHTASPTEIINEKIVRVSKKSIGCIAGELAGISRYYAVYFVENGIKINIIFNKDGGFVSSVRYYTEEFYHITCWPKSGKISVEKIYEYI